MAFRLPLRHGLKRTREPSRRSVGAALLLDGNGEDLGPAARHGRRVGDGDGDAGEAAWRAARRCDPSSPALPSARCRRARSG